LSYYAFDGAGACRSVSQLPNTDPTTSKAPISIPTVGCSPKNVHPRITAMTGLTNVWFVTRADETLSSCRLRRTWGPRHSGRRSFAKRIGAHQVDVEFVSQDALPCSKVDRTGILRQQPAPARSPCAGSAAGCRCTRCRCTPGCECAGLQDVVAEVPAVRLLLEALVAQPLLVAGNLVAADERRSRWSQPTSASHI
jgi:hypothetical protein